ncbi:glycosyltransferase [Nocardioides marmorisolisilvae]|uniref:Glycosyltransferase n=1 Tax=Nocardioides marmorisolisilvae TaxID=1542737 RepID=A0A3N0DT31_9ACTN|nr:glycosyltransferase [Nocardioides marmorisolisilvae]RNL78563.1 glycosyltransferase [Nocardioides marmorisolisilvae]
MRILLVADTFAPAIDPVADAARHVTDALVSGGHEVLVVTTTPGQGTYRGATVLRTKTLLPVAEVRAATEQFAPDAAWFLAPRAMGAAAMRALEPSCVPMIVVDPTPLHPRAGTVLATSRSTARVLAAAGIKAGVWLPGVRTDEHHPGLRSTELHDRWAKVGKPEGPLTVVGYVGPVGLPTSKRVRRLSRIAALDGVRLVVLGCGAGTATLKDAGAKIIGDSNGLELARAIASLDVLVQPRKQDSSLGPVRKALASGVPVVAFDSGATADVVRDRETGLLVRSGTGGLVTAVGRLASDEVLRARLAANARESVSDRTWFDAVAELLAHSSPRHATAV